MKSNNVDIENQIAILQAMLSKIKYDDPKFRLQLKKEIGDHHKGSEQITLTKEIIRRLRIQNKKLLGQVSDLRARLNLSKTSENEIRIRLNELTKQNNAIAGALGSCNICWGEDPDCIQCSGKGVPGWRKLNKRLFDTWVLPALDKLNGLQNQ